MAKYSRKAEEKISDVMHEYGEGKLKSGRSGKKVKDQKQAVAIAISEARRSGAKVPKKKSATKKKATAKKKTASKRSGSSRRKTSPGRRRSA
jgi:hypothetical protein